MAGKNKICKQYKQTATSSHIALKKLEQHHKPTGSIKIRKQIKVTCHKSETIEIQQITKSLLYLKQK